MSSLVIVFLTVFIDLLGFGIIIPLLPFYAVTFGGDAFTVGLLATSFSLMQFIFAPIWGRLSDRVGRRPIILGGLFGSFAAYTMFGLADTLTLLFVSRMFAGVAAANIPTAQAFIADKTTPENRAKGMGLIGAAFGLGFIFGPAIGGFLSRWGYGAPAFFAAGLSLANFTAAWFLLPESLADRSSPPRFPASRLAALERALTRPGLPVLLVIQFVGVTAFSGFETTFALFGERRFAFTAATIGYGFAFVGILMALVQGFLVGRAAKMFGERTLVLAGMSTVAAGFVAVPMAQSLPVLALAVTVLTVGMAFNGPSLLSLISRLSDEHDQGGIMGVSQSLASLARIVGPAWAGFSFERIGVPVPYISSAILMGIAVAIGTVGLRRVQLSGAAVQYNRRDAPS